MRLLHEISSEAVRRSCDSNTRLLRELAKFLRELYDHLRWPFDITTGLKEFIRVSYDTVQISAI